MNRFVPPFQGYRAESNLDPGRRYAANAAPLWADLFCPFGAEEGVYNDEGLPGGG